MAAVKRQTVPNSIYLSEQSQGDLRSVISWLEGRISDMEEYEEDLEGNETTLHLLPSLRGLLNYIREEYYEGSDEDFGPHFSNDDDEDESDLEEENWITEEDEDV